MLFYTGFNLGCALSKNTASILVFRFLAGTFGASPLTNSGGVIADIWDVKRRGIAMSIFSIAPFAGPALGPIVSGAIQVTGTSWRWLFYTCTIFSGVCLIVTALTLKETYAPIILTRKAKRIRKETGDDRYVSPLELSPLDPKHLIAQTLGKPFVMLGQEIILLSLTVYMSFIYGVVYLLFEGESSESALIFRLRFPTFLDRLTHSPNSLTSSLSSISLPSRLHRNSRLQPSSRRFDVLAILLGRSGCRRLIRISDQSNLQ